MTLVVTSELMSISGLRSGTHHIPVIKQSVRTVRRWMEMYDAIDFKVMFV